MNMVHGHGHSERERNLDGPTRNNDLYYVDNIELTTVGIDVGSSTSHLMFSRLHLQRLGKFLSSRYVVVERVALHRSPILLTPYTTDNTIDTDKLGAFIREAYAEAGLTSQDIDSGAIILTGEALKRSNARAIADLFASEAGKFVCASAGHNLEAILAANGSGALELSRQCHQTVLNVDIGGGTSKFALMKDGEIVETAAINVGGRLIAVDDDGRLTRIELAARTVAQSLGISLELGEPLAPADKQRLAESLADCLIEMISRKPRSPLGQELLLTPPLTSMEPIEAITFSGGVSEFVYQREDRDFGDLSWPLARALQARIAHHDLPAPDQAAGERIRATVIGASQFTVQVSGNTISIADPTALPIHNLQVLYPRLPDGDGVQQEQLRDAIARTFQRFDLVEGEQPVALALNWAGVPSYALLRDLAGGIVHGLPGTIAAGHPLVLVFAHDFGKLVGDILREEFGVKNNVISIDSIVLQEFDYIDIGEMIYPAQVVPVVVKSLVFPTVQNPQPRGPDLGSLSSTAGVVPHLRKTPALNRDLGGNSVEVG
jgi:ethanolamine utilization protein EutA